MAELDNLFAHRGDFKPSAPNSVEDICKCSRCANAAPFGEWKYLNGMDSGFWCDDCNDFHSCFECPNCGEYFGAAGAYNGPIEVEGTNHEWREVTTSADEAKPSQNHVRDAVRANF